MKITAYKIASGHVGGERSELEKAVNALIKEGWQPFGSVSILPPTPDLVPQADMGFQVMVRVEADRGPKQ